MVPLRSFKRILGERCSEKRRLTFDEALGLRAHELRVKAALCTEDVACNVRLPSQRLLRIEAGKVAIKANELFALATYVGVPVAEFFRTTGGPR